MRTSRCTPELGLQPAVGVLALDQQRRRLDAGLLARALLDQGDLVAALLRPAHVHARQHARPSPGSRCRRRRRAPRDRCRCRRPRPTAAPRPPGGAPRSASLLAAPPRPRRRTASSFSASPSSISVDGIVELALELADSRRCARSSAWRSRMTFCARSADCSRDWGPRRAGSARPGAPARCPQSKMPPQQRQGLADGFGEFFGFGAHGGLLGLLLSR